jgi:DNA-binding NarL/FixJ family response regulator
MRDFARFLDVHTIVIAADTAAVREQVIAVLDSPEIEIFQANSAPEAIELVKEHEPDLVISDLQMGSMGGIAMCLELRLLATIDEVFAPSFLLLLDRRADVFQARRAAANGWVIKPLDPIRLRRATAALLAGDDYDDTSFQPSPVNVAETLA